jgi:hypothetical protein
MGRTNNIVDLRLELAAGCPKIAANKVRGPLRRNLPERAVKVTNRTGPFEPLDGQAIALRDVVAYLRRTSCPPPAGWC